MSCSWRSRTIGNGGTDRSTAVLRRVWHQGARVRGHRRGGADCCAHSQFVEAKSQVDVLLGALPPRAATLACDWAMTNKGDIGAAAPRVIGVCVHARVQGCKNARTGARARACAHTHAHAHAHTRARPSADSLSLSQCHLRRKPPRASRANSCASSPALSSTLGERKRTRMPSESRRMRGSRRYERWQRSSIGSYARLHVPPMGCSSAAHLSLSLRRSGEETHICFRTASRYTTPFPILWPSSS